MQVQYRDQSTYCKRSNKKEIENREDTATTYKRALIEYRHDAHAPLNQFNLITNFRESRMLAVDRESREKAGGY